MMLIFFHYNMSIHLHLKEIETGIHYCGVNIPNKMQVCLHVYMQFTWVHEDVQSVLGQSFKAIPAIPQAKNSTVA